VSKFQQQQKHGAKAVDLYFYIE